MRIEETLDEAQLAEVTALQVAQQETWRNAPGEGQSVDMDGRRILVSPGVFPPRSDTSLLARNIPPLDGSSCLDVGTGSGVLAIMACVKGAGRCVALDINPDAVRNVDLNSEAHGYSQIIEARESDGLSAVGPHETFDFVIANLPGRALQAGDHVEGAQWDEGFRTNKRFFEDIGGHLTENGRIVMTKANYPELNDLLSFAEGLAFRPRILDRLPPKDGDPRTYYALEFTRPAD